MERRTKFFLYISIFVILLPSIARSEDCTETFSTSRGQLESILNAATAGAPARSLCRFFIHAPVNQRIVLNVTRLVGFPKTERLPSQREHPRQTPLCLPRLVIDSGPGRPRAQRPGTRTICSRSELLPLVVQSESNKLRIIFYGSSSESSGFSATYTFHTKHIIIPANLSVPVRYPRDTTKTVNSSEPNSAGQRTPPVSESGPSENSLKLLEIFVLLIVTPVAVICMCAILVYHCRKKSSCLQAPAMSGRTPGRATSTSDVTTVASNSPLLSGRNTSTFSAQQNQDMLRQQRIEVCRRSPSTEKYPVSIPLRDEDEPPHLRGTRLNPPDPPSGREGVRGPPNRTVYDSEMYSIDSYHIKQIKAASSQQPRPRTGTGDSNKKTEPVRTLYPPSSPLSQGVVTPPRGASEYIIDSVTRTPVDMADACDEPPPPYSSVVPPLRFGPPATNNNSVCESRNPTVGRGGGRPNPSNGRSERRFLPRRGSPHEQPGRLTAATTPSPTSPTTPPHLNSNTARSHSNGSSNS